MGYSMRRAIRKISKETAWALYEELGQEQKVSD